MWISDGSVIAREELGRLSTERHAAMIRIILFAGGILCAGLLASACRRDSQSSAVQIQIIDASGLRPAFGSSTPEVWTRVDNIMMYIQDSDHARALAELAALSNTPNISESQKQVIATVVDQINKQAAARKR